MTAPESPALSSAGQTGWEQHRRGWTCRDHTARDLLDGSEDLTVDDIIRGVANGLPRGIAERASLSMSQGARVELRMGLDALEDTTDTPPLTVSLRTAELIRLSGAGALPVPALCRQLAEEEARHQLAEREAAEREAERDQLADDLALAILRRDGARVHEGADPTPPDPGTTRTTGQIWHLLLTQAAADRAETLTALAQQAHEGAMCWALDHRGQRAELAAREDRLSQAFAVLRGGYHEASRWEHPLDVPRWVSDLALALDYDLVEDAPPCDCPSCATANERRARDQGEAGLS